MEANEVEELKSKNSEKLQNYTFNELFYNSLGVEHFAISLVDTDRLLEMDLSNNDLGPNFSLLQKIFKKNINIELLNLADCAISGD